MVVNIKRGLWRIWVVISILWAVAVMLAAYFNLHGEHPWGPAEYRTYEIGGFEFGGFERRPSYGFGADLFDEAVKRKLYRKIVVGKGVVLFTNSDNSDEKNQNLVEQFQSYIFWERVKSSAIVIGVAASFPAAAFILGVVMIWVFRGFSIED